MLRSLIARTLNLRFIVVLCFWCCPAADGAVLYVDGNARGADDGTTWIDAFRELPSALAVTQSGDEIWVAVGTYLPDFDVTTGTHTGAREATFQLVNGVGLYGERINLAPKNYVAHRTLISGGFPRASIEVLC